MLIIKREFNLIDILVRLNLDHITYLKMLIWYRLLNRLASRIRLSEGQTQT